MKAPTDSVTMHMQKKRTLRSSQDSNLNAGQMLLPTEPLYIALVGYD